MQSIFQSVSAEAAAHLQIRRAVLGALALSLATNAALALTLLVRDDASRTVVLAPQADVAYVAGDDYVSPNLLERFAAQACALVLDLTPATAASRTETFLKNVAPEAYAEIAAGVRRGVEELVRNYASSVFYPHASAVDERALAACFIGERRMMIGESVTDASETTVCMRHVVSAGRIQISQLRIGPRQSADAVRELASFLGAAE